MRRLLFLLFVIFALVPAKSVFAGSKTITEHYKVNGECEQCKARIEKAAYNVKGVRFADWNVDSHDLTVKYDSTKTNAQDILKSIAHAGHDNALYTSTDDEYNSLPECCHYRSEIKKH